AYQPVGAESALHGQEFAYEAAQAGQADRAEHHYHEQHSVDGHRLGEATHVGYEAAVQAVVYDAHAEEEATRQQAMGQHDDDSAVNALRAVHFGGVGHEQGGEETQRHETHVADARIRYQLFEVGLDQGY